MFSNERHPENANSKFNRAKTLLGKDFGMTSKADGYWLSFTGLVNRHEKMFGALGSSPFNLFSQESDAHFPFLKNEENQGQEKLHENSREPIKIQLKQRFSLTLKWGNRKDHRKNIFPGQNKELVVNPGDLAASNRLLPWSWVKKHGKDPGYPSSLPYRVGRNRKEVSSGKRFDFRQYPVLLEKKSSKQTLWNFKTGDGKVQLRPHTRSENRPSLSNLQTDLIKGLSINPPQANEQTAKSIADPVDKFLPFIQRFPISWYSFGLKRDQKPLLQEPAWNSDIFPTKGGSQIGNINSGYSSLEASRILSGRHQARSKASTSKLSVLPGLQRKPDQETGTSLSPQWSQLEKKPELDILLESVKTQAKNHGSIEFMSGFAIGKPAISIGKSIIFKPWNRQSQPFNPEPAFLRDKQNPENFGKSKTGVSNLPSQVRTLQLKSITAIGNKQEKRKDRFNLSGIYDLSRENILETKSQGDYTWSSSFLYSTPDWGNKLSFKSSEPITPKLPDAFTFPLVKIAPKSKKDRFSESDDYSASSTFSSIPPEGHWSINTLKTKWLSLLGDKALSGGNNVEGESSGEHMLSSIFSLSTPVHAPKLFFNTPDTSKSKLPDIFSFSSVKIAQKREKERLSKSNAYSGNSTFSSSPSGVHWPLNTLKAKHLSLSGNHTLSGGNNVESESSGEHMLSSTFSLSVSDNAHKSSLNSLREAASRLSGIFTLLGQTSNGVQKQNDGLAQSSNKANIPVTEEKRKNGVLSLLKSNHCNEKVRTTLIETRKIPDDLSKLARNTIKTLSESHERANTKIEHSNKESDLLIRKLTEQLSISQQNSRADAKALLQAVQTLNQQMKQADTGGLKQQGSPMRPLHFLGPL